MRASYTRKPTARSRRGPGRDTRKAGGGTILGDSDFKKGHNKVATDKFANIAMCKVQGATHILTSTD